MQPLCHEGRRVRGYVRVQKRPPRRIRETANKTVALSCPHLVELLQRRGIKFNDEEQRNLSCCTFRSTHTAA